MLINDGTFIIKKNTESYPLAVNWWQSRNKTAMPRRFVSMGHGFYASRYRGCIANQIHNHRSDTSDDSVQPPGIKLHGTNWIPDI